MEKVARSQADGLDTLINEEVKKALEELHQKIEKLRSEPTPQPTLIEQPECSAVGQLDYLNLQGLDQVPFQQSTLIELVKCLEDEERNIKTLRKELAVFTAT